MVCRLVNVCIAHIIHYSWVHRHYLGEKLQPHILASIKLQPHILASIKSCTNRILKEMFNINLIKSVSIILAQINSKNIRFSHLCARGGVYHSGQRGYWCWRKSTMEIHGYIINQCRSFDGSLRCICRCCSCMSKKRWSELLSKHGSVREVQFNYPTEKLYVHELSLNASQNLRRIATSTDPNDDTKSVYDQWRCN